MIVSAKCDSLFGPFAAPFKTPLESTWRAARYARGELRPVYFYPDDLKGHIARRYRPGETIPTP